MRNLVKLLGMVALLLSSSCRGSGGPVSSADTTPSRPSAEDGSGTAGPAGSMPFFVEVTQTTTLPGTFVPPAPVQVGPADYVYTRDEHLLLLNPRIVIASGVTNLLIGEATILQTPSQSHENREIFQYPPAQPNVFEVVSFDLATGRLEFVFAGETHVLAPGESLTFKLTGTGSNPPAIVTKFANHGGPRGIEPLRPDGSVR